MDHECVPRKNNAAKSLKCIEVQHMYFICLSFPVIKVNLSFSCGFKLTFLLCPLLLITKFLPQDNQVIPLKHLRSDNINIPVMISHDEGVVGSDVQLAENHCT